jgi:hypothetical protein
MNLSDTSSNNGAGTWWSPAVVAAWFHGNIQRSAAGLVISLI